MTLFDLTAPSWQSPAGSATGAAPIRSPAHRALLMRGRPCAS